MTEWQLIHIVIRYGMEKLIQESFDCRRVILRQALVAAHALSDPES